MLIEHIIPASVGSGSKPTESPGPVTEYISGPVPNRRKPVPGGGGGQGGGSWFQF